MRPRPYDRDKLDKLRGEVPDRTFQRFDGPSGLLGVTGEQGPERLRCTVVASSYCESGPSHMLGDIAPVGEVVLVRRYRYCEHDNSPHFNVDDQLLWADGQGRAWKATPKESPDHYMEVFNGTVLVDAMNTYQLPVEQKGSIEVFRQDGARLDFGTICPLRDNEGS